LILKGTKKGCVIVSRSFSLSFDSVNFKYLSGQFFLLEGVFSRSLVFGFEG